MRFFSLLTTAKSFIVFSIFALSLHAQAHDMSTDSGKWTGSGKTSITADSWVKPFDCSQADFQITINSTSIQIEGTYSCADYSNPYKQTFQISNGVVMSENVSVGQLKTDGFSYNLASNNGVQFGGLVSSGDKLILTIGYIVKEREYKTELTLSRVKPRFL